MLTRDFRLTPPKALYFVIFTISGFSGLIYESIWSHYLKLFLGHAAYAQSLVLSIFMGGMAAGAWLAGRYSTRWRTPILAYAVVEAVIGIFALIFHNSFVAITDTVHTALLPATDSVALAHALKWTIAAFMIIPQSILLGMTFPLMTAGIIRRYPANSGASLSLLYFTNSIGAAAGVLASGFWLIRIVGLPGTIMTAGLINILLALAVWVIVRLDTSPATTPIKGTAAASDANKLLLAAAFITGMASFIYEIGWIRMLSLVLGSSTHAFELMLSAFITGLAFGGLWIRKRIDTIASPVLFAAYVQIVMGLLALLTLPLYGFTFDWMNMLLRALARTEDGYTLLLLASHGIVLFIMLPATFCAGMTLPLFTHALMKTGYGEKSIGQIYAFNTFGSIVGVLFAVNMLPVLGVKNLISAGAVLDMALGIALLFLIGKTAKRSLRPAAAWSVTAAVLGLLLAGVADITGEKLSSGVFRYMRTSLPADQTLYYYRDGKTASISLYGTKGQSLTIATNGKPDAAINYDEWQHGNSSDESTMSLAAILPLGYKTDATLIANIGMGSGMTTHMSLTLPQVTRVDTIEIEPAIVEASRHFGDKVGRAHADPRSRIHIEDAKTFFSLSNTRYDIIISEPSNPWVSGVSSLFTEEFYGHIKRALKEDGILMQWIHLYENNLDLLFSILKAIDSSFDDYALYFANNGDLLIAARNNGKLGVLNTDFLFADPGLKQALASVQVKTKADLHYRLIADKKLLSPVLLESGIPMNSDYFPFLDQNAHKAFFMGHSIKELYTEAFSFPVVEMLREPAARKELTDMALLMTSSIHKMAKDIARWISSGPETEGHLRFTNDIRNETFSLIGTAAYCDRPPYDAQFLGNLHNLAKIIIAGLDKETASAALQSPTIATCSRIAKQELASWIEFYQAVATRDFERIKRAAEKQLKTNNFERHKPMLAYVLSAAMVAHYHTRTPEGGRSLWKTHAWTFNPGEEPFYLRLATQAVYSSGPEQPPTDTMQVLNP